MIALDAAAFLPFPARRLYEHGSLLRPAYSPHPLLTTSLSLLALYDGICRRTARLSSRRVPVAQGLEHYTWAGQGRYPSVSPHAVFLKYLARKQTYRAVQYFARFLAWYLLSRGHKIEGARWNTLKSHLALGRKRTCYCAFVLRIYNDRGL